MKILGIDPGLANTGWSVVEPVGGDRFRVVCTGLIKTDKKDRLQTRVVKIADTISSVVAEHSIKYAAAEDIFFTKNVSSCIEVAKVIGSLIYSLGKMGVSVSLFTPTMIKQTVTGGGKADKKMIEFMVMQQFEDSSALKTDHQADSAAAALTFFAKLKSELLFESGNR